MKWLLWLAMLCLLVPGVAWGQNAQRIPTCGSATVPVGNGPVYMDSSGNLCVAGSFSSVTGSTTTAATLIRANNTTTYKAGGAAWNNATPSYYTFTNACATTGGGLTINGIDITSTNNPTLLLSGVLWLFNVVPSAGSILADDATFNIATADFANLTGGSANGIPFVLQSAQASGAGNSGVSLVGTNLPARCAGGSKTLYGIMEVANQYVPAALEPLTVTLTGITTQ